jgi:hypothetical protein
MRTLYSAIYKVQSLKYMPPDNEPRVATPSIDVDILATRGKGGNPEGLGMRSSFI